MGRREGCVPLNPTNPMAKLFIGISLALMLVTATLGFLAKSNIDKVKSGWSEAKQSLTREQANVQTAKNDLKKATEDAGLANDKAREAAQALESKATELAAKNQQLSDAQKEAEAQTAEIDRLKKSIAGMPVPPAPGVPDPRIAELTEKLQKAEALGAEKDARIADLISKGKENEGKVAELEKQAITRGALLSLAGLQGRILAVNSGWNFVVLNIGDKQGVAVNAPLLVVRGNAPVARLRITSVENSKSIADVVPSSVAHGVTIQPGDTVIFEGRSSVTELAKPPVEVKPPAPSPSAT